MKRGLKENPKNIKLLGASSFFNDVGSDMIAPLLPFYITALGGGGIAIGLLSGLREGLSSLLKIIGGWLSDKIGKRKIFVFSGYLFSVIARFLLAIAVSWQQLVAFMSFERFGKIRDAPRDAIISVSTKKRGKGFGIQQMMDTSGAVLGTLLVLFLFWKFKLGFKPIIIIASSIAVLSLFPLIFVKEPKTKKFKKSLFTGISSLDKRLKYFIFTASVFTFGNFGLYMFLLLRTKNIAGSTLIALVLYALFSLCYAGSSIPAGILSDKFGRKKVLLLGYVLFLMISLGLIFASKILPMILLFSLYGLVYGITQTGQRAFVSDLSGDKEGTGFGFYHSVVGLVTIPGGIIAGILWNIDYKLMFSYISVLALISVIMLIFVKEKYQKPYKP